jgi:hypothetical protein
MKVYCLPATLPGQERNAVRETIKIQIRAPGPQPTPPQLSPKGFLNIEFIPAGYITLRLVEPAQGEA